MSAAPQSPTPPDLPERYRPRERIGVGGIGEVWRVVDGNLRRDLAAKVLRPDRRSAEHAVRLTREALLTGRLQHPGVPPVVEQGLTVDGHPFFIMKLVGGANLRDVLAGKDSTGGRNRPDRLLTVVRQVCETVGFAHAAGIVHRDLKPANVMVGAHGEVQVMDWGLAALLRGGSPESPPSHSAAAPSPAADADGGADGDATIPSGGTGQKSDPLAETVTPPIAFPPESTVTPDKTVTPDGSVTPSVGAGLRIERPSGGGNPRNEDPIEGMPSDPLAAFTVSGAYIGTPAYMPPEQARGDTAAITARSDVFGLGGILCRLLTGKAPFATSGSIPALRLAVAGDLSLALSRLGTCGADGALIDLCRRCLSKDPADRPADGAAVAEELRQYEAGVRERLEREKIARAAAEVRVVEERKVRRASVGLAIAALCLVLTVGAFAWDRQQRRLVEDARASEARTEIVALLGQARTLQADYRFDAARALLDNAAARAAEVGADDSAEAVAAAVRDLSVVQRLDEIRLKKATPIGGFFETAFANGPDGAYAQAFAEGGIALNDEAPAVVGARIATQSNAAALVAALDDWAADELDPVRRERLLRFAEAASPHPVRAALLSHPGDDEAWNRAVALPRGDGADESDGLRSVAVLLAQRVRMRRAAGLDAEDGLETLAAAAADHPSDFWLQYHTGLTFAYAPPRQSERAIGYYRAALAVRPENAGLLYELGNQLWNVARHREAETAFRRSVEAGGHAHARINLAHLLSYQNRGEEAEALFRNGLLATPDDPALLSGYAYFLAALGRHEEAVGTYRRAIERVEFPDSLLANLAGSLRELGRIAEAEATYRELLRRQPLHADVHHQLGFLLENVGRLDEAETAYREAIRRNPGSAQYQDKLGYLLQGLGRAAEAEALYREAIRLEPEDPMPHRNLGLVLLDHTDEYVEALGELNTAIELGRLRAMAELVAPELLAEAELLASNPDRMKAVLAGEAAPADQAEALTLASFALIQKGRPLAAARLFETALSTPSPPPTSFYNGACACVSCSVGAADAAGLSDDDRANWRGRALDWLGRDLQRLAATADPGTVEELRWWLEDDDLTPVRTLALASLPAGDRRGWERLWNDHAAVLRRASGPLAAPRPLPAR
ncbi:protein kinase domain-containing protein [Alienimonas chondri]|uniref:Serine/threonine-protein kinase PknD n=1 Tax=Alienimonas chondri TaxID=2681879 RepID=A0ABX1VIM3_9PLAN|nr:serine/threonine-protein kinase [Alienimonas chondri]NNJ27291.1 Serine/threonine-protein kinase PknD [Alienimonas chondri]